MKSSLVRVTIYWVAAVFIFGSLITVYAFSGDSNYFCDRLLVLYKDDKGASNVLRIELVRYNVFPHFYSYEYSASLTGEDSRTYSRYFSFNSLKNAFKADDFITRVEDFNNENILNERYLVDLEINNKRIDIDLKNMTNDFLINNSLDRLTYVNLGSTIIKIDGVNHAADFALNKTASINRAKLAAEQSVQSKGLVAFFSDLDGGLYYVDTAHVYENSSRYMSHSWALNKQGQILKKSVGDKVSLLSDNEKNIIFNLPDFNGANAKLDKITGYPLERERYNLLSGELIDNSGERRVIGISLHYDDKN